MSSIYGNRLKLSLFGQSHGKAVGMTLDGIPAGLPVELPRLQAFLDRRAPGSSNLTTSRKEADIPEFLAGIVDKYTCGAPITAIIANKDHHPCDYVNFKDTPRPSHADYTAQVKYRGFQAAAGGGHFSGRLTAPMCIAGGLCLQWLERLDITISAQLIRVGNCQEPASFEAEILRAKEAGDSVGGIIECTVMGLPAGLGDPIFDGMESRIAQIIFGIPGIKGLEFGSGFAGSRQLGSEHNDPFCLENGKICTKSNHCGGILGGLTNGMPLTFRVAVKPTPSIAKPQESVSLTRLEPEILEVRGRHDPCIALRAVPVVEAAAAIAIFDAYLEQEGTNYGA